MRTHADKRVSEKAKSMVRGWKAEMAKADDKDKKKSGGKGEEKVKVEKSSAKEGDTENGKLKEPGESYRRIDDGKMRRMG